MADTPTIGFLYRAGEITSKDMSATPLVWFTTPVAGLVSIGRYRVNMDNAACARS